jgi:Protein of unknown function (DUF2924)
LFRVLAYGLQAAAHGDLDKSTRWFLDQVTRRAVRGETASLPLPTHSIRGVRPGTVLVREWAGVLQHVMALDHGYAWNGTTYRSLSEVARAITGTHWNGPRFFGLRQARSSLTGKRR